MTTKHLHVLAIVPGDSSGWCLLTVPRYCVFGDEPSEILERDYGEFHGPEPVQAEDIARLAREIQGLDYKTGPAIIIDHSIGPISPTGAMLRLLEHQDKLADSTLHFQDRELARKTMTDGLLRKYHLYVAKDNINDAHKHAITALRQARESPVLAHSLWPYPANGTG